jgi:hypothetical protein
MATKIAVYSLGGEVSSLDTIESVSFFVRSSMTRLYFAKTFRILPENIKIAAEKIPNKAPQIWNNIPPVFGSIYIYLLMKNRLKRLVTKFYYNERKIFQ